jgi:cyclophilin family peptidyl-prolyl cis-trans isomerase
MAVEIRGRDHFITIETAPNDLMPHSVHSFMEMVEDKTWDNTLMVAADHIIMATLEGVDGKLKNFDHAQRLVFPEYTDEFPHIANTVGFGGRPGGPEFYFNLDDNRDIHGPGGQPKHALIEEADPCFGKIIHGLDVLEKMMQNNPTLIKHMRILSKEEYMQQN